MDRRARLAERILQNQGRLMTCMRLPQMQDVLTVDLTMPQFKVLVLLDAGGSATVGQLARGLGVGLSTMTGIVDRLCDQDMVTRGEDPEDRRATRVRLSATGAETMARFHQIRREAFSQVLDRLTDAQLEMALEATDVLAEAAEAVLRELPDHDEAPVGAGGAR